MRCDACLPVSAWVGQGGVRFDAHLSLLGWGRVGCGVMHACHCLGGVGWGGKKRAKEKNAQHLHNIPTKPDTLLPKGVTANEWWDRPQGGAKIDWVKRLHGRT